MSILGWMILGYFAIGYVLCFRVRFQEEARDGVHDLQDFVFALILAAMIALFAVIIWPMYLMLRRWDSRGVDWAGVARRVGGEHPKDRRQRLAREAEDRERYIERLEREVGIR
jgi:hypothetical protein